MTPTQHIRRVQAATINLTTARTKFETAIKEAVAAGCTVREVAAASGLGKSRISVIAQGADDAS